MISLTLHLTSPSSSVCVAIVDTFARDDIAGLHLGALTLVPAQTDPDAKPVKAKTDIEAAA
jgi:hypothetical protein